MPVGQQVWTTCPVCNVEIRVNATKKTIWAHSPKHQTVIRKHGPLDPNLPEVCAGSSTIAAQVRTLD